MIKVGDRVLCLRSTLGDRAAGRIGTVILINTSDCFLPYRVKFDNPVGMHWTYSVLLTPLMEALC